MRLVLSFVLLLIAPTALAQKVVGADDADPFARFGYYNSQARTGVKHDPFEKFVEIFAEERGDRTKVAFESVKDRGIGFLSAYVTALERINIQQMSKNDQLAFWLNLHNAAAIGLIGQEYPVRSVDDIGADPLEPENPWTEKTLTVLGLDISLHDIAENILAAHWKDQPDVLYGLYQGAKDSPKLIVFNGFGIEQQLEEAATAYINRRGSVKAGSELRVSTMYRGYGAKFFDNDEQIIAHLTHYAEPKLAKKLAEHDAIDDTRFSWRLSKRTLRNSGGFSGAGFGGGTPGGGGSFGS